MTKEEIIERQKDTIDTNEFKNVTGYFCSILGVSRSVYYNYINSEDNRINKEEMDLKARDIILNRIFKQGVPGTVLLTDITYHITKVIWLIYQLF